MGRSLRTHLDEAAVAASMAYGELAEYLRTTYAPDAAEADAVGAERCAMLARGFLGAEVDLAEAYEWGWDELGRIEADMVEQCALIRPGASIDETVAWLETESDLVVEGSRRCATGCSS